MRAIKNVMVLAGVVGRQACPRGLRHGFGVGMLQSGTVLPIIQRWMGRSRLSTTAIHTNVCGSDENAFATRLWTCVPYPSPFASWHRRALRLRDAWQSAFFQPISAADWNCCREPRTGAKVWEALESRCVKLGHEIEWPVKRASWQKQ